MSLLRHAPIVLVHGLFGFDRMSVGQYVYRRYFPGIEEGLAADGHRVRAARLSRTRGVAARALELRRFIRQEFPAERVHVFAHSMGGLDARYMISKLEMADHVLSLTTIGTPHRGSSFADWGIRNLGRGLRPIFRMLNICPDAFFDLTTDRCRRFNEEVPDSPDVRYFSIAGKCDHRVIGPFWKLPQRIVWEREGANDGVVSIQSARYGERCEVWQADHMNLVNWRSRSGPACDFTHDYRGMVNRVIGG